MVTTELLADTLRAEVNKVDLQEDSANFRLLICAQKADGKIYNLGHVSLGTVYRDRELANRMIDRIKYSRD